MYISQMDYILYCHEPTEAEWGEDVRIYEQYAFRFYCHSCRQATWGVWKIPDLKPGRHLNSYHLPNIFERGRERSFIEWAQLDSKERSQCQIIDTYHNEARQFVELTICPVCGADISSKEVDCFGSGHLDMEDWNVNKHSRYYPDRLKNATLYDGAVLDLDENIHNDLAEKHGKEQYEKFINQQVLADCPVNRITIKDADQLKAFLEKLVNVEKSIYSVSERLKWLYIAFQTNARKASASKHFALMEKRKPIDCLSDELKKLQSTDPTKHIKRPTSIVIYPAKPISPTPPREPVLATPGLFNKKRILAENAALTEQYEKERADYEAKLDEYNKKLSEYQEKRAEIMAAREREYREQVEQVKAAHREECEKLEQELQTAQQEYDQLKSEITTAETVIFDTTFAELKQAKELLVKLYQARNEMYATDVIFEKYRDFVAVSTFYEYLCSGRCESLDGVHGAYNLYESELRMNLIVSQLSAVVEGLEEIKNNQYVLYSAINETNRELKKLNSSMATMNKTLTSMKGSLANISANSDIIAHNSEIAAFYAKKNAELTDALGFMVALK